jgi:hypothetical protein
MHCYDKFQKLKFDISKLVSTITGVAPDVTEPERLSCLFCIRMCVHELDLQKESVQYHCFINPQKLTDHFLGFK